MNCYLACWIALCVGWTLTALAVHIEVASPLYSYVDSSTNGFEEVDMVGIETDDTLRFKRAAETEDPTIDYEKKGVDNHDYYTSRYYGGDDDPMQWWVDLDNNNDSIYHPTLSETVGHKASKMPLNLLNLLYYGHPLSSATITTGGFLYVGQHLHQYLAATQYIAPLMANFDLNISSESCIRYCNLVDGFTVEWNSVQISEKPELGNFTFQTTIFNDSRIVFVYKQVPVELSVIPEVEHPVKVGIADAYYVDITLAPYKIKRQIYQYHMVELDESKVVSNSAILLTPLQTCNVFMDCASCERSKIGFNCSWCPLLHEQRCSSGFDRHRQQWLDAHCENRTTYSPCPQSSTVEGSTTHIMEQPKITAVHTRKPTESYKTSVIPTVAVKPMIGTSPHTWVAISAVVGVCLLILILSATVWTCYAYKRPTSKSGLFLLEFQRNHLSWKKRRGDVKYKYQPQVGICSLKDDVDI